MGNFGNLQTLQSGDTDGQVLKANRGKSNSRLGFGPGKGLPGIFSTENGGGIRGNYTECETSSSGASWFAPVAAAVVEDFPRRMATIPVLTISRTP